MAEKAVEEREKQGKGVPSSPSAPVGRVRLFMRFWIVLTALAWGATAHHMLLAWLGAAAKELFKAGEVSIQLAHGGGLVVAVLFAVLGLMKLDGLLDYYKPGQARWTRLAAIGATAGMTLFGCATFYADIPSLTSYWWQNLWEQAVFGKQFLLKPVLFPSIAIFTTVMLVAYLLLNRRTWAEFQIETEGELKKVSWPPRKEFLGASMVVVVVVAIVSCFLYAVDLGLSNVMKAWGIGF